MHIWHSLGKEMLLICPRQPISVRCWTRIWTHILLPQGWSFLWTFFCPSLYHTRISFVLEMVSVCVVREWRPCWDFAKLWTAAATSRRAPWLIHSKCWWSGATPWSPFHVRFLSFRHYQAQVCLPGLSISQSGTYICRNKKKRMTTFKVHMLHPFYC